MPATPTQLRDYLDADERLTAACTASLAENDPWTPVALGVTDRRLLCVSEGGTFLNLRHDAIAAIRSRPRTTKTYRGADYRLLVGLGAILAIVCAAGVVAYAANSLVPFLLPALVGGLASAEYQRRKEGGIDWAAVMEFARRPRDTGDDRGTRRDERSVEDYSEDRQVLLLANGLVAAVAGAGILALASGWLVVVLTLGTIAGVALIDYGNRHRSDFDGIDVVRRRELEVSVDTIDGNTVRIRCDPADAIDRELSRAAFVDPGEGVPAVSPRSRSTAGAGNPER